MKQLYEASIAGTASWNNSFNNKAFLAGELHPHQQRHLHLCRRAKALMPSRPRAVAEPDIDHALWPIGPAGKPTEFQIAYPMSVFQYSKFPNACKAFIEFML